MARTLRTALKWLMVSAVILILVCVVYYVLQGKRGKDLAAADDWVRDIDPAALGNILGQKKRVVLEFYTANCPYCLQIAPELSRVAREYSQLLTVVKMNAEKYPGEASRYRIPGVPTLVFFDTDGSAKLVAPGYRDYAGIVQILRNLEWVK